MIPYHTASFIMAGSLKIWTTVNPKDAQTGSVAFFFFFTSLATLSPPLAVAIFLISADCSSR